MHRPIPRDPPGCASSRRRFLEKLGHTTVAVATGAALGPDQASAESGQGAKPIPGKVRQRVLGKTGLSVSEVGFGGHSWSFKRVADGRGGFRQLTLDEAELREDLSASWTALTPTARERPDRLADARPCPGYRWLEDGWRYA